MKNIQIFDPALCCSSGVCGVDVDHALVSLAADLDWAKQQGVVVERFNLAQQPMDFAQNATVKVVPGALGRRGASAGAGRRRGRPGRPLPEPCRADALGRPGDSGSGPCVCRSGPGRRLLLRRPLLLNARRRARTAMNPMKFLQQPPRFLFFTGKGGVGKTSIACATAIELATRGQRVLLVSTDPASNVGQVFGIPIGNHITPVAGRARAGRAGDRPAGRRAGLPRPHRRPGARAAAG